jgi:hypothetical protein
MYHPTQIIPKYTENEIYEFVDNDDYMDAYVELLKDSIECLWYIVYLKYFEKNDTPKEIGKDDAVVGGNLIRLIKLNTSFLENICLKKSEICLIVNRCIAETAINLKYLLIESEERVKRNYIKYSLITEKELWEVIKSNIKERPENVWNIEKRMQKSIQNSFDNSDFDLDDINRSSKWKSIKSRADAVAGEMFYSVYYGISSHSVHGNWQDILTNNLDRNGENFKLHIDWQEPKPQMMDLAIILNLDILNLFIQKELDADQDTELLKKNYNTLLAYGNLLIESHEKMLKKKNGL